MKTKLTKEERELQAEFRRNYRSLVKTTTAKLLAYGEAALKSGTFDLTEARGPYQIPKNVLTAACLDTADQWGPVKGNRTDEKMVKNVRLCTPYP